jgi:peptidase E
VRGCLLCNGNIPSESDFIAQARDLLLTSRHEDPAVAASRKVLLVTAGWGEREYEESHVKAALHEIGISSQREGGFEVNVQNLSVFHAYQEFCRLEPEVALQWKTREQLIEATRNLYLEKNAFYIAMLRRSLAKLKQASPDLFLAQVMSDVERAFSHPPPDFDGDRLLAYFLGRDLRDTIARLVENDDRMVELLHDLDDHFADGTGLHHNRSWRRLRQELEDRILGASSIFVLGGNLNTLHRTLNFFRLRETFAEALRRGTSYFTSSAGSLLMCERIIVFNDFPSDMAPRREFQLFDRGFGLVRQLQVFPHCMDRIQTDDTDNLAYLAHRFQNRTCVGLNEQSLLLVEANGDRRFTSVGRHDGVYVFDTSGTKVRVDFAGEIPIG